MFCLPSVLRDSFAKHKVVMSSHQNKLQASKQAKKREPKKRSTPPSVTCITSEDVANSICSKDFVVFVFGRLLIYLQSFVIQTAIYSQVGTLFWLDYRYGIEMYCCCSLCDFFSKWTCAQIFIDHNLSLN